MQRRQQQNQRLVVALLGVLRRGVVRCCSARLLFAQQFKSWHSGWLGSPPVHSSITMCMWWLSS